MAQTNFDYGEPIFTWTAHDYHPHQRGMLWYTLFSFALFGSSLAAIITDPQSGWMTAFTLCLAAAAYFFVHRNGHQDHEIKVTPNGLVVDDKSFYAWDELSGFWILRDPTVSVINFEFHNPKKNKFTLQMGLVEPTKFRQVFNFVDLPEIEGQTECLMDLWIRALKL